MSPAGAALALGSLALLLHVLLTAALLRLSARPPVLLHAASAAALVPLLALGLVLLGGRWDSELPFWPALSILYGGAVLYLFAFSALYKSVSLNVLAELAAAPGGRLALDDVARRLVLPLFADRIRVLVAQNLVARTGDGYAITDAGRRTARRLRRVQRLAGVERSGLYRPE